MTLEVLHVEIESTSVKEGDSRAMDDTLTTDVAVATCSHLSILSDSHSKPEG